MTPEQLQQIRDRLNVATPGFWGNGFQSNYPFYVQVQKPAPSLSKHDDSRADYWRYEDGVFLAGAVEDVRALLDEVERLQKALLARPDSAQQKDL